MNASCRRFTRMLAITQRVAGEGLVGRELLATTRTNEVFGPSQLAGQIFGDIQALHLYTDQHIFQQLYLFIYSFHFSLFDGEYGCIAYIAVAYKGNHQVFTIENIELILAFGIGEGRGAEPEALAHHGFAAARFGPGPQPPQFRQGAYDGHYYCKGARDMRHNGERRPEEIQAEIERTRGDMHATLSAIEQRLTPGQLVDQGLDYLKNSGAREFTSNLGNSVKNNPMPVALMGIAVAWMMIQGNRKPAYAYSPSEYGYGESGTAAYGSTGSAGMTQRAGESLSSAKDRMSQSARSAKETLSSTARSATSRPLRAWRCAGRRRAAHPGNGRGGAEHRASRAADRD